MRVSAQQMEVHQARMCIFNECKNKHDLITDDFKVQFKTV